VIVPGGCFVVSLDLELHWGVRDHAPVSSYRDNLLGVRQAVPAMLELFARRDVAATWATVGMLFAETRRALERSFPSRLPRYRDARLSPYDGMAGVGEDEARDPFHFAPSLLRLVAQTPRQEIGTHTFSHYYCLEEGQTEADFDADLDAAARAGSAFGDTCRSLVFPRNQVNERYFGVLRRRGVRAYRSNGTHWAYRAGGAGETLARRAFRLADAYLPLGGARPHPLAAPGGDLRDVPAGAFLRPYDPRARRLDGLRLRRITSAMTRAARRGEVFHLWWHPHNFGRHPRESMELLGRIVDHLDDLRRHQGMESLTMAEAAGL
jgi:peptidoglycan/xylan/chitin deacetylase (PgdA/CDA1 family)